MFERLEDRTLLAGAITQVGYFDTWDGVIPSTDAAGITFHAPSGNLYIADSEINETPQFQGNNIFETSLAGDQVFQQIASGNSEPTGITYNEYDGYFYVTNDKSGTVLRYDSNLNNPLIDITVADDVPSAKDPEGITSDPATGFLYVADGASGGRQVLVYNADLEFQYSFSVAPRVEDPEGIAFDKITNHLFMVSGPDLKIFEYTLGGAYVEEYDISGFSPAPDSPQGLTFGPTSNPHDGSSAWAVYIADGMEDNDPDGRVFEAVFPNLGYNQPPTVSAGPDQTVVLPANAVLDAAVSDDGAPEDPGAVTTTWSQVSGPPGVTFGPNPGGASAVDTTATFPAAGTYVLRLTANDGELINYDEVTITVTPPGSPITVETRVTAGSDDPEEKLDSGRVKLSSGDLDLGYDGSHPQAVGLRFTGISVPPGAFIKNAYIQFQVDEASTDSATLTIHGEAIDDAPAFTSARGDISSRTKTNASVSWKVASWDTQGEAGPAQRTSNIATVIQEIVNGTGWSSGNSLVTILTGEGVRAVEAYDGKPGAAPLLHVEYMTGGASDPPIVTATSSALDYTENSPAAAIDPHLTVTDSDDTDLVGATVVITGGLTTEDVLTFTNQNGITGNFAGAMLTLTGAASVEDYQTALRSVTYENTNTVDPDTATRTVTFTVDDGQATGADSREITISEVAALVVSIGASSVDENAGAAATTGMVTRVRADSSQALTVTLSSSDLSEAMVPSSVTIGAGQTSASFPIHAIDDQLLDGMQTISIRAAASGYVAGSDELEVLDNDRYGHNVDDPMDVNADGVFNNRDVFDAISVLQITGGGALNNLNGVDLTDPVLYPDVDDNGYVVYLDILRLISDIRQSSRSRAPQRSP